jgi:hypothetical protein
MNTDHSYGNYLAQYVSPKGRYITLMVCAYFLLAVFVGAGILIFFANSNDTTTNLIVASLLFVTGGAFFFGIWWVAKSARQEIVIYENGVTVKIGKKLKQFHYSEIAGLREMPNHDVSGATVGGGALGGVIGAVIVHSLRKPDAGRRDVAIIPAANPKKQVLPLNTSGGHLSWAYTGWLLRNIPVTPETIPQLSLSFGKKLRLDSGVFTYKKMRFSFADITGISAANGFLSFNRVNESGKLKAIATIAFTDIVNLDLLFTIFNLVYPSPPPNNPYYPPM